MIPLRDNINRAISDFNSIKKAIIEKGVEVPNGTPTNNYSELIKKIKSGSSSDDDDNENNEDSEDWSPPENWIELPDPEDWQVCLLVEVVDLTYTCISTLNFANRNTGNRGYGKVIVDWGDGTIDTYEGYDYDEEGNKVGESQWDSTQITHTYSDTGQYVIKATTSEYNCLFSGYYSHNNRFANVLY